MRFVYNNIWHLFLLTAGLILFYVWAFRQRRRISERFVRKEFLAELAPAYSWRKNRFKSFLSVTVIFLSLLSLMRPQWGFRWEEVKRKGLDILIAIDTSRSMLAEDVKPSRLERSKLAVKDLIKKISGDRIGLIAFSGRAFLQCPLTVDYSGFILSLDDLNTDTIPRGGTAVSSAINEAIASFEGGQKKYKILIIITDGEDHEGDPIKAAEAAKKEGVKIFCIGIGSTDGELIPVIGNSGRMEFLKDKNDNVVKTRLNEGVLEKIALTTGGSYVRSTSSDFGLELIYREKLSKLEKRDIESKMKRHYEDRFQIPLGIALMLFVIESLIGDRKRKK